MSAFRRYHLSREFVAGFAAMYHAGQTWGGHPYTHHLSLVEEMVERYAPICGVSKSLQVLRAAAWLHDTVEDTSVTIEMIEAFFGKKVAEIVWAVTDEPGATRAERKAATYPKTKALPLAVFLKLCDRIVNVENAMFNTKSERYLAMYREERESFSEALRTPGLYDPLWAHLDGLFERGGG